MRKIKCILGILAFLSIGLVSFSSPSVAHVGDDPHVPDARYNNYANINFNIQPNMNGDAWGDAVRDVDDNTNGIDIHKNECGQPGQCINVLINRDCDNTPQGCGHITLLVHPGPGSDTLVYLQRPGVPVGQSRACRGIQFTLGGHLHHGDGCLNEGAGTQTTTICCGEGFAISQAYCNACRVIAPDNSEELFVINDNN